MAFKITNRTGKHWEFGAMALPPGESRHSDECWATAKATTCARDRVVMAGTPGADTAPFVAEKVADAPTVAVSVELGDAAPGAVEGAVTAGLADEAHKKLMAHSRGELRAMADELGLDLPKDARKAAIAKAIIETSEAP